jgi:nucleotide-binding universal stress UspA family protein
MERIVVGVDGSDASLRALQWALDEARRRQAAVEIVHAWHQPHVAAYPSMANVFDTERYEKAARTLLDTVVEHADLRGLPEPIDRVLIAGHPAEVMVDAAQGADMVVVGSRGLGNVRGMLLGSVSQHLVHHAPCPVVVVPRPD